jgi:hypothetical protein
MKTFGIKNKNKSKDNFKIKYTLGKENNQIFYSTGSFILLNCTNVS